MANEEHLDIFRKGTEHWIRWRQENPTLRPDLSGADFRREDAHQEALLRSLGGLTVLPSMLNQHIFRYGDFSNVNFCGAKFCWTTLYRSDFRNADLSGADLTFTQLIETDLTNANLTGCHIYGVAAWNLTLEGVQQRDLIITRKDEPVITVDNLEVAQFIYLLLNNEKIRAVIDTITSKMVLILGRFTDERKRVLDALREELRSHDYLPVLFDFEKPASRNLTETISTLAHMARFVIADITDAKSIPQELKTIVPDLPSVPVQPLLLATQHEYAMFEHIRRFPWVLEPFLYDNEAMLLTTLNEKVIGPAEAKAKELIKK